MVLKKTNKKIPFFKASPNCPTPHDPNSKGRTDNCSSFRTSSGRRIPCEPNLDPFGLGYPRRKKHHFATGEHSKADILIFSNIDTPNATRENGTVWACFDGGKTWPIKRLILPGPSRYSALIAGRPGTSSEGFIYLHGENIASKSSSKKLISDLSQNLPKNWTKPLPSKSTFRFDPKTYNWTAK